MWGYHGCLHRTRQSGAVSLRDAIAAGSGTPLPRAGTIVDLHYHRVGARLSVHRLLVLESRPEAVVTFQPRTPAAKPLVVDGSTILEPGSPVIWFTFPERWHDIGLFHRTSGAFTGLYANILTPVEFVDECVWSTTDLCLDVWLPRRGPPGLIDEDELAEAQEKGLVQRDLADRARAEATALVLAHRAGQWPPPETGRWSLATALEVCRRL